MVRCCGRPFVAEHLLGRNRIAGSVKMVTPSLKELLADLVAAASLGEEAAAFVGQCGPS